MKDLINNLLTPAIRAYVHYDNSAFETPVIAYDKEVTEALVLKLYTQIPTRGEVNHDIADRLQAAFEEFPTIQGNPKDLFEEAHEEVLSLEALLMDLKAVTFPEDIPLDIANELNKRGL